jgi:hypothetical protein
MLGEGGFTHQPPSPKPPSPTGGNNNETQPDFADINLLPTKNGLDFGVHLRLSGQAEPRYSKYATDSGAR